MPDFDWRRRLGEECQMEKFVGSNLSRNSFFFQTEIPLQEMLKF